MPGNLQVQTMELVHGLSTAIDLVSPSLVNHHRQVFGLSYKLAETLRLGDQEMSDICIAAMLHDIGVVAFNQGVDTAFDDSSVNDHAEMGYRLMKRFKPFAAAAEIVRNHHRHASSVRETGYEQSVGSSIIHLADQISARLDAGLCVLTQSENIRNWVKNEKSGMFLPDVVEVFLQKSAREDFWLDICFDIMPQIGCCPFPHWNLGLDMQGLLDLSELFRMIIDFRSRHTATHSRSVAHIAEALAKAAGFSGNDCIKIHVAGNLHDLGKLATPVSILDNPGSLSAVERTIVKAHPYHTHRILKGISGLGDICSWASFHHECLDGSGYPFHLGEDKIPIGARIIAVADVFTALSESRYYRHGMKRGACLRVMQSYSSDRKLDPQLISLIDKHYDEFYDLHLSVQQEGVSEYKQMLNEAIPLMLQAVEQLDRSMEINADS
ncbi:MAG: HD domain-containing protein [Geobacteraceae bacterium]|nr:HD domain-containing protein [Geobacteraceae bacterium]